MEQKIELINYTYIEAIDNPTWLKQEKLTIKTIDNKNDRIRRITFHTFRHRKATMEFHKTRNILHVMKMLGHKTIQNTLLYTQLISFESEEWHVAQGQNLEEENKLIEAGFEYVRYSNKDEVAIYRKRK